MLNLDAFVMIEQIMVYIGHYHNRVIELQYIELCRK